MSVIGGGQMGSGIALVAAQHADQKVKIIDVSEPSLLRSKEVIQNLLSRNVDKGKISSEEMFRIMSNISFSQYLEDALPSKSLTHSPGICD
jgi:3-hydroxybutyryl-CoA dehydrogenase